MSYLFLCSAITIRRSHSDKWLINHIGKTDFFEVSDCILEILLSAANGISRQNIHDVLLKSGADAQKSKEIVRQLVEKKLLTDDIVDDVQFSTDELFKKWCYNGWAFASLYHLQVRNWPFMDYTTTIASKLSNARMNAYSKIEPDTDRINEFMPFERDCKEVRIKSNVLDYSSEDLSNLTDLGIAPIFAEALDLVFGVKFKRKVSWNGADLFHKISPSGGSRHPIEAYFVVNNFHNKEINFAYHINGRDHKLTPVSVLSGDDMKLVLRQVQLTIRADYILFLSAVYTRNMYRYRDPRTLRSVYLDAGHVVASLTMCLDNMGMRWSQIDNGASKIFDKIRHCSKWQEDCIALIAIEAA